MNGGPLLGRWRGQPGPGGRKGRFWWEEGRPDGWKGQPEWVEGLARVLEGSLLMGERLSPLEGSLLMGERLSLGVGRVAPHG